MTTLDRSKLNRYIGSLPPDILIEVNSGLKASLDLM
ncbi:MAG: hypothetical protein AB2L14_31855 [Candidatus Xenobiia bacterium LiM19]